MITAGAENLHNNSGRLAMKTSSTYNRKIY
jgi:hypothetical protein